MSMSAAVATRYGDPSVVEVASLDEPSPASGQVLVRVRAASLNPIDSKLRGGELRPFLRLRFPAILGFDLAGEVAGLGDGVSRFEVGERVYGRIDSTTGGTHAELAAVDAAVLDRIPEGLPFEGAAALPLTTMTALQALAKAGPLDGRRLLVNGAAGGVGTAAVQIGRARGATVTGVCSAASAPLVSRLGADVLDYTKGELETTERRFDVVFDTLLNRPLGDFTRVMDERATYVTTGFSAGLAVRMAFGLFTRRSFTFVVSRADGEVMENVSRLVAAGEMEPVIDSTFPLERAADAHRRLDTGHAHGKVVLTIP